MQGSFIKILGLIFLLLSCLLTISACDCGDDDDDDNQPSDDDDNDNDGTPDDDDNDDDGSPDDDDGSPDDDDNDSSPSPADPFCEAGKEFLRSSTGYMAAEQFEAGLALDDQAVNCRYGLMLSGVLRQFDLYSVAASYIESFLEGYIPPSGKDWPQTGQGFIDALLNLVLDNAYFNAGDDAMEQAAWLREFAPDVVYPLDQMPIFLNFDQIANPGGDYDLADAIAAAGFAGAPSGLIENTTALNLDFEIGLIFELTGLDFGMPIEDLIGTLVAYGLRLFDNPLFPDFFTLKEGGQPFKDAGLQTGLGFRAAQQAYQEILSETGDQSNEVLGYDDLNGNQKWDEGEPLVIPELGSLSEEDNAAAMAFYTLFDQLANSFLDYTDYDSDPENPQPFHLAYLNPILQVFGLPALIPDLGFLVIDFGAAYRDADPTQLRDTIRLILNLLASIFPPPTA